MTALLASGLTCHAVSKELRRSPHTIKKYSQMPEIAEGIEAAKAELADMFEGMARKMLESISSEDIEKINAYQRIVSSGIATDKMRLLRGESTQNINYLEASQKLAELEAELARLDSEVIDITPTESRQ